MPRGNYIRSQEIREKISKALKGRAKSEETKRKISKTLRGRVLSEETRKKISKAMKGKAPWTTGRHLPIETRRKISEARLKRKNRLGYINSPETRRKISEAHKGKKLSEEHKRKIGLSKIGNKYSLGYKQKLETRIKHSEALRGERAPHWKGGITPLAMRIRRSFKYRQWRSDIFTRDDFTCQKCGRRGGCKLNAHHIIPFNLIMELNDIKTFEQAMDCEELWNINNGITLCEKCHRQTDNWGFHQKSYEAISELEKEGKL